MAKLEDFRIVHNHLVNDPIMNIANPEYLEEIEELEILKIEHKNLIDLDTTNLSAGQTAEYILNKIKESKKCQ